MKEKKVFEKRKRIVRLIGTAGVLAVLLCAIASCLSLSGSGQSDALVDMVVMANDFIGLTHDEVKERLGPRDILESEEMFFVSDYPDSGYTTATVFFFENGVVYQVSYSFGGYDRDTYFGIGRIYKTAYGTCVENNTLGEITNMAFKWTSSNNPRLPDKISLLILQRLPHKEGHYMELGCLTK